jgi:hypothetical protein
MEILGAGSWDGRAGRRCARGLVIPELSHITVSAGYSNSDQRKAHRNPANIEENRPNGTVLFKL